MTAAGLLALCIKSMLAWIRKLSVLVGVHLGYRHGAQNISLRFLGLRLVSHDILREDLIFNIRDEVCIIGIRQPIVQVLRRLCI